MKRYGHSRAFALAVAMATLATMALGTGADEDRAARRDLDAMQGTWRMIPSEDVPPELLQFAKNMKVVFRGDRLTLRLGDREQRITKIRLRPSRKPMEIDGLSQHGQDKEVAVKGIYELKDKTLRICWGDPRPSDFAVKKEGWRNLWVLKRDEKQDKDQ